MLLAIASGTTRSVGTSDSIGALKQEGVSIKEDQSFEKHS